LRPISVGSGTARRSHQSGNSRPPDVTGAVGALDKWRMTRPSASAISIVTVVEGFIESE
jgi:hypothetical protein